MVTLQGLERIKMLIAITAYNESWQDIQITIRGEHLLSAATLWEGSVVGALGRTGPMHGPRRQAALLRRSTQLLTLLLLPPYHPTLHPSHHALLCMYVCVCHVQASATT